MADIKAQYLACPIRHVVSRFGDKWSMLVLYMLYKSETGVLRFNEIRKLMSDCSQKMLSQTLKNLEQSHLVHREVYPEVPPRVEYSLTDTGRSLMPVLTDLIAWGQQHLPKRRGFHLVTSEILSQLPKLPKTGIVNIFTKHTSCGLSINENCDPDVRVDMETIFNRLVPENRPEYEHTLEGADDMPAHAKSTLSGVSITIPITDGRLNLGTWQGVYFCEFRNYGGSRELVVTIIGE